MHYTVSAQQENRCVRPSRKHRPVLMELASTCLTPNPVLVPVLELPAMIVYDGGDSKWKDDRKVPLQENLSQTFSWKTQESWKMEGSSARSSDSHRIGFRPGFCEDDGEQR